MADGPKLIPRPPGRLECAFCGATASIDAPTIVGGWAYMCLYDAERESTPEKLAMGFRWEL